MTNIANEVIEYIENEISAHVKLADELKSVLEDIANLDWHIPDALSVLLDDWINKSEFRVTTYAYGYSSQASYNVYLPWNGDMADKVLSILFEAGWELEREHDFAEGQSDQRHKWILTHKDVPNFEFELYMQMGYAGSLCEMVKVGTEMKEVPIFEIQCKDN